MPSVDDRIKQVAVHFACTIPLRTELKPSEREALKVALEELDRDHFQIFGNIVNPSNPQTAVLFAVQRQYPIDAGIATAPSLVFEPAAISILHAVKIGPKLFTPSKNLSGSDFNHKAREALFKIQEITKVKFTRAGKIFELVVGPFSPAEKQALLARVLNNPTDDICELQLQVARAFKAKGKLLNINTQIRFQQLRPEDAILAMVRFDINNRTHETSLDQRDVDYIWKEADSLIEGLIGDVLDGGGDHGKS